MFFGINFQSFYQFAGGEVPQLKDFLISVATCEHLSLFVVNWVSADVRSVEATNTIFLTNIPNSYLGVPATRDEHVGFVSNALDAEYSIGVSSIIVHLGRTLVHLYKGSVYMSSFLCLLVVYADSEVISSYNDEVPQRAIVTAK